MARTIMNGEPQRMRNFASPKYIAKVKKDMKKNGIKWRKERKHVAAPELIAAVKNDIQENGIKLRTKAEASKLATNSGLRCYCCKKHMHPGNFSNIFHPCGHAIHQECLLSLSRFTGDLNEQKNCFECMQ
jgi:hypothetical protein